MILLYFLTVTRLFLWSDTLFPFPINGSVIIMPGRNGGILLYFKSVTRLYFAEWHFVLLFLMFLAHILQSDILFCIFSVTRLHFAEWHFILYF